MIVSYEHGYIFIKTRKVAGTSVEMALSRHCGPHDVITPIYPRDELRREPSMRYPQNFALDPTLERAYVEAAARKDSKSVWALFPRLEKQSRFFNHMDARSIRERVGEEFWNRAFKFTIDRNPYDAVLSNAYWRIQYRDFSAAPDTAAIRHEIEGVLANGSRNIDSYRIDDAVAVDRILRFENLQSELASIADRIGGDISTALPRAKRSPRRPEDTPARLLTKDQQRRIAERYADAFDLLGYSRALL